MSNALIDALLPANKLPRPGEAASPRASERGKDFAPALNKALDARQPESPSTELDDDDWERHAAAGGPASSQTGKSRDADSRDDGGVNEAAEADERGERSAGDAEETAEDSVEDSVEISAEAEAAAAAGTAVAAAPVAAEDVHAEHDAEIVGVLPTASAGNGVGGEDGKIAPAAPAAEPAVDAIEGDDVGSALPLRAATEPSKSADESAAAPAATPTAANAENSATGRKRTREADDQLGNDGSTKPSAEAAQPEAPDDQASTADVAAELDAAIEALHRGEPSDADSRDASSHDARNAAAASTSQTTDAGRAPHSGPPARFAAERSLQAEAAGDNAADRSRFVGRVEGAIRAAHQRDGRIQVRLSPPELGALRIELTIQQGALAARLEAETPAARNVLLDNLPALRERLAQQDIRVERFDVDLRQDASSGGGSSQQGTMQEQQPREADWRQRHERSDRGRQGVASTPTVARITSSNAASDLGLDVRV